MKVLLLVDDYLPGSIKVAARMMHDLALELIEQGNDVTVCAPDDSLDESSIIDSYNGVRVLRFKSGKIKNVSKVKRAINETLLSLNAWTALKAHFQSNHHDLVVYYSPTIFFGPLVWKLKSIWRAKSFLILRDIFPQWVVDNGLISKYSPVYMYFKLFEAINYNVANIIAVQSPSNKAYFAGNISASKKVDVLFNWSSSKVESRAQSYYRKKLGLVDKVVFFYGGNIGHAQDMMNLVRLSMSLSGYPEAHFLFVGQGDEVCLIEKAIKDNDIKNITYLPAVNQTEYEKMLAEFDIGLFSLHKDHVTHNFPGKLLGYMKHSIPILGSVNRNNDLATIISDANAGFVSVNGDDADLVRNALKLLLSADLRGKLGRNAFALLDDTFSVKSAVAKILNHNLSR